MKAFRSSIFLFTLGTCSSFKYFFQGKNELSFPREHRSQLPRSTGCFSKISSEKTFAKMISSSLMLSSSADVDIDGDDVTTAKEKATFSSYFQQQTNGAAEMTKTQFLGYSEVKTMIENGLIYSDDLDDLWISAVGDASGLNEQEAYEMLCMVRDLPDPEQEQILDLEFDKLTALSGAKSRRTIKTQEKEASKVKGALSYLNFLNWSDVQEMINEEIFTVEEITNIWRDVVGDLDSKVDRITFGRLNRALDDAIDAMDAEGKGGDATDATEVPIGGSSEINPWAKSFVPKTVFTDESLSEINAYFDSVTKFRSPPLYSFTDLSNWSDMKEVNILVFSLLF